MGKKKKDEEVQLVFLLFLLFGFFRDDLFKRKGLPKRPRRMWSALNLRTRSTRLIIFSFLPFGCNRADSHQTDREVDAWRHSVIIGSFGMIEKKKTKEKKESHLFIRF